MNRFVFLVLYGLTVALETQEPAATTFEVASIRPSSPNPIPVSALGSLRLPPDRWRGLRLDVVRLIGIAYPAYAFDGRVVGGPPWIREELFDIEAKKDPNTSLAQVAPMMAHLLATRFALRTHVEQRAIEVYVLKHLIKSQVWQRIEWRPTESTS